MPSQFYDAQRALADFEAIDRETKKQMESPSVRALDQLHSGCLNAIGLVWKAHWDLKSEFDRSRKPPVVKNSFGSGNTGVLALLRHRDEVTADWERRRANNSLEMDEAACGSVIKQCLELHRLWTNLSGLYLANRGILLETVSQPCKFGELGGETWHDIAMTRVYSYLAWIEMQVRHEECIDYGARMWSIVDDAAVISIFVARLVAINDLFDDCPMPERSESSELRPLLEGEYRRARRLLDRPDVTRSRDVAADSSGKPDSKDEDQLKYVFPAVPVAHDDVPDDSLPSKLLWNYRFARDVDGRRVNLLLLFQSEAASRGSDFGKEAYDAIIGLVASMERQHHEGLGGDAYDELYTTLPMFDGGPVRNYHGKPWFIAESTVTAIDEILYARRRPGMNLQPNVIYPSNVLLCVPEAEMHKSIWTAANRGNVEELLTEHADEIRIAIAKEHPHDDLEMYLHKEYKVALRHFGLHDPHITGGVATNKNADAAPVTSRRSRTQVVKPCEIRAATIYREISQLLAATGKPHSHRDVYEYIGANVPASEYRRPPSVEAFASYVSRGQKALEKPPGA